MDRLRERSDETHPDPDFEDSGSIETLFGAGEDVGESDFLNAAHEVEEQWPIDPKALSSRWSLGRSAAVGAALIILIAVVIAWWSARPVQDVPHEQALSEIETHEDGARSHASSSQAEQNDSVGDAAVSDDLDHMLADQDAISRQDLPLSHLTTGVSDPGATRAIAVHVVGHVRRPGLVYVAAGARWADAINAAGGLRKNAAASAINLAALVTDGQQIHVPKKGDATQSTYPSSGGNLSSDTALAEDNRRELPATEPAEPGPTHSKSSLSGQKDNPSTAADRTGIVDINRATEDQLQQLPGIGPALAKQIVAWRESSGGCSSPDQLLGVPGIGPARYAALSDLVSCR